jgi:hypothetical protein
MRVPVQAPALVRNQRSGLVRRFGRRRAEVYGVRPSQYGGEEGEQEEEGGGESGEEGSDEGGAGMES